MTEENSWEGRMAAGQLPYSNTRLVLQEELEDDSQYFLGTVVRLFHSPTSHPAVRQTLQGLSPRRVSLGALAVQALVNKRGPDGVVGVIPGEEKHSARLLSLCQSCHDNGEVLACSLPSADMVLVPRLPSTAAQDGLFFLAYATNLRAVELCEQLRQQKQVALVLDLDNTLVDAVSCTIAPNDWGLLDWQYVLVTNSYGRQMQAQYAPLPGHDSFSDDVWVMHWKVGRINCTFKVRIRRGWADLREFLAQNADKYAVFVCSKGKREYIQLLWLMLDPLGQLIPESDWDARLTSTFPDTLTQAANKTALTALGCYDITKPHVPTQVAMPMLCLDDSTEAYEPDYEHSIVYVQEYRPSDLLQADNGNVLRQARNRLEAFWTATCTSDGTFAWQAAQSFAMALMKTMQRNPMGSPNDLSYLQVRCAKQGEALWHQFTVREVFGEDGVFIADDSEKDVPRRSCLTSDGLLCATCQLPECKPGCPGSGAHTPVSPAAVGSAAAAATDGEQATAAVEAALSEGRSSEDSILLGLPSPKDSVLSVGPALDGLHSLACNGPGAATVCDSASFSFGGGDDSPTAEPDNKHPRLCGWDTASTTSSGDGQAAGAGQQRPAVAAGIDGWAQMQHAPHQPARAAAAAGVQQAAPAAESALAAALRGLSKGLLVKDDQGGQQPPVQPPLPAATARRAPWQSVAPAARRQQPAAAGTAPAVQSAANGAGSGNSALAAALASISKGLFEDGLL